MTKRSGLPLRICVGITFAVAASIGGCSSSSSGSGVRSGAGQSCTTTADCSTGLACFADVCATAGSIEPGVVDAGVVFALDAGGAVAPADASPASEAAPPPRLSDLGESCSSLADCAEGLVCVPSLSGAGGVCDLASYGLTPTGKTCSGECVTGADCCELPLGVASQNQVKTCQDVLGALMGNTTQCATAIVGSQVSADCFLYSTYCSTCATGNVWSCAGNQCVYNLPCQTNGTDVGGCPTATRTGRVLSPFCDPSTGKCQTPPRGICDIGSDCDGKGASDGAGTCRGGDCTCYLGGCYISCASTLDCAQGYSCDTTSSLCTQDGTCSSDAQCADQTAVVNAKCVGGACKLPCMADRDCGASGLLRNPTSDAGGFGGQVCGSDGFCDDLGCASDADCREQGANMNADAGTLNYFCVTPPAPSSMPAAASAITN